MAWLLSIYHHVIHVHVVALLLSFIKKLLIIKTKKFKRLESNNLINTVMHYDFPCNDLTWLFCLFFDS